MWVGVCTHTQTHTRKHTHAHTAHTQHTQHTRTAPPVPAAATTCAHGMLASHAFSDQAPQLPRLTTAAALQNNTTAVHSIARSKAGRGCIRLHHPLNHGSKTRDHAAHHHSYSYHHHFTNDAVLSGAFVIEAAMTAGLVFAIFAFTDSNNSTVPAGLVPPQHHRVAHLPPHQQRQQQPSATSATITTNSTNTNTNLLLSLPSTVATTAATCAAVVAATTNRTQLVAVKSSMLFSHALALSSHTALLPQERRRP